MIVPWASNFTVRSHLGVIVLPGPFILRGLTLNTPPSTIHPLGLRKEKARSLRSQVRCIKRPLALLAGVAPDERSALGREGAGGSARTRDHVRVSPEAYVTTAV